MPLDQAGVRLSSLDTNRFGIVVARADRITKDRLEEVYDFCSSNRVQLLICRCAVEDTVTTHALTASGCSLMDTLVYFHRDLTKAPIAGPASSAIEVMRRGDPDQVEAIARASFREYTGHYHADPRLDRDACTETYASWARACCEEVSGSFVLVTGDVGRRVGFAAFRQGLDGVGELVLAAVAPPARGAGLYRKLTLAGMLRLQDSGVQRFITSTHLSNWSAQMSWIGAGLHPYSAFHTFHRWFDRS